MNNPNLVSIELARAGAFPIPASINKEYRNGRFLAAGEYGVVCRFDSVHRNKQDIAVKKFTRPFESAKRAKRCYRELQLLRNLDHENVVKLLFMYTTDKTKNELDSVYLTTEYCGADLRMRLERETEARHVYNLKAFKRMISELLRALKYINSANVVHRDLKPDNLAIDDSGKLTLLDFGFSRGMDENGMTAGPGNGYYRAIETISFAMEDRQIYNEKADIWSIGAILCQMFTGEILFKAVPPAKDHPPVTAITICGPIPEHVILEEVDEPRSQAYLRDKSRNATRRDFLGYFRQNGRPWLRKEIERDADDLLDFINGTLVFDHRARMTVDEAIAHPFLAAVRMPSKEIVASHTISDVGNLPVAGWRQHIWDVIQASPVR